MRRFVVTGAAELAFILTTVLVACGPSKPNGSAYLGKWEGTGRDTMNGFDVPCHFDISTVGQSYLIKGEGPVLGNCKEFGGIFILTPEGNLKRGSGFGELVISYDKDKNQAIVSAGGEVKYWTRTESLNVFLGTWQFGSEGVDASGHSEPIGYLRITKTSGGGFQAVEGFPGCDNGAICWRQDVCNLALSNGRLEGTLRSYNFRATHGTVFDYHLAVERIDNNNVLYTVQSELSPETHKAHKIG